MEQCLNILCSCTPCTHMQVFVHARMHVCVCACACMRVCVYVNNKESQYSTVCDDVQAIHKKCIN